MSPSANIIQYVTFFVNNLLLFLFTIYQFFYHYSHMFDYILIIIEFLVEIFLPILPFFTYLHIL